MVNQQETIPSYSPRHLNEIAHGRRIAERAEAVWGWDRPTGPIRLKRRTDLLIHYGNLKPGKKVLELGCGTGLITEYLARSGADITAIDLSPDLLEKARRKTFASRVHFQLCNAEATNFPDETFEAVVGSSVLHHLNLDRAILEIDRILKPGGYLALSEPNMVNPHIFLQKNIPWIKRLAGDSPDETAYIRWILARKLAETGFRSIAIAPYDFLHPLVPTSLIPAVCGVGNMLERVPFIREFAGSLIIAAIKA